jgi:hypothetical protein
VLSFASTCGSTAVVASARPRITATGAFGMSGSGAYNPKLADLVHTDRIDGEGTRTSTLSNPIVTNDYLAFSATAAWSPPD